MILYYLTYDHLIVSTLWFFSYKYGYNYTIFISVIVQKSSEVSVLAEHIKRISELIVI